MPKTIEYIPPPESGLTDYKAKATMRRNCIEVTVTNPKGETSDWDMPKQFGLEAAADQAILNAHADDLSSTPAPQDEEKA